MPILRRLVRHLLPAAVLAVALSLIVGVPRASAHDQVISTAPSDGEHLDTAPSSITMRFTQEPLDLGAVVMVGDAVGTNWALGEPTFSGPELTQPLAAPLPDGAYTVRWRVVSGDGHVISDSFAFTVGVVAPASTPTSAAGPAPTQEGPDPAASQAPALPPALRLTLAGLGGAIAGIAIYVSIITFRRRMRRP